MLHWLLGKESREGFVRRRVDAIKKSTGDAIWRYCPSKMNPADALSRGVTMKELIASRWSEGPEWLKNPDDWPQVSNESTPQELSYINKDIPVMAVHHAPSADVKNGLAKLIDVKNYSSMNKLLRVTARVERFVVNCRTVKKKKDEVDSDEKQVALKRWIKVIQLQNFNDVLEALTEGKGTYPSIVKQLRLFLDEEDIIRCNGRLDNAMIPLDTKNPILLPRVCSFTKLVIIDAHLTVFHG